MSEVDLQGQADIVFPETSIAQINLKSLLSGLDKSNDQIKQIKDALDVVLENKNLSDMVKGYVSNLLELLSDPDKLVKYQKEKKQVLKENSEGRNVDRLNSLSAFGLKVKDGRTIGKVSIGNVILTTASIAIVDDEILVLQGVEGTLDKNGHNVLYKLTVSDTPGTNYIGVGSSFLNLEKCFLKYQHESGEVTSLQKTDDASYIYNTEGK